MNYPLISEYIEAIKSAEDNFEELSYLRPVLGDDGLPVMTSGNFAVVFKMKDEQSGKFYAVKCFTKEQEGREEAYHQIADVLKDVDSPYLVSLHYLDKELFVDTEQTSETEFPVLLMDWVEGKTLDRYLRENLDDKYALEMLAYRFSLLAQWLIPQPFAHGDLKPDNILVREDGTLVLVDYDGMYVPAMKGQKARELGSPDFRHPYRTENDFDEDIDDFPFTCILLSIKAISINPKFLEEYGSQDRLLLSKNDYLNISNCYLLKEYFPLDSSEYNKLCCQLVLLLEGETLCASRLDQKLTNYLIFPNIYEKIHRSEILDKSYIDENGVKYSSDRLILYEYPEGSECIKYTIKDGTLFVGDWTFAHINSLEEVVIPESVICIGKCAFTFCYNLEEMIIPDSVGYIGDEAFCSCRGLKQIKLSKSLSYVGFKAFQYCVALKEIVIPNSLSIINAYLFQGCYSLEKVILPNSIEEICSWAFSDCLSLQEIIIPNSVISIGHSAFSGCKSLKTIVIPPNVKRLSSGAFRDCTSLETIEFLSVNTDVDSRAFDGCALSLKIYIPKGSIKKFEEMLGWRVFVEK